MSTPPNNQSSQKSKKKHKTKKKHIKKSSQKRKNQQSSSNKFKKQDGKQSPPSITLPIAKKLFNEQEKDNSTLKHLEQINEDMKEEVDHFEKEFVNNSTNLHVIKPEENTITKKDEKPPRITGTSPLPDITTKKSSQLKLASFGFGSESSSKSSDKNNSAKKEDSVSGVQFNLFKVEEGTFEKIKLQVL